MELLAAARAGDEDAFGALVLPYRRELTAHCYRILGSAQDAEDAVQETLLAAWRGLAGFQERSSLRTWLHRIATHCALRLAKSKPARLLSWDHGPARRPGEDLGSPVEGDVWVEPLPTETDHPERVRERREHIGLAYVAALQRLPPNQRAVLILRDVLGYPAAEVAGLLDTTPASVNSALQRAHATLADTTLPLDQVATPKGKERSIVAAFVTAFDAGDVSGIVDLLAEQARFTMPPLPAWLDGKDDVIAFLTERVFALDWRARPARFNDQPSLACYQPADDGTLELAAVLVLDLDGDRVTWLASFIGPDLLARIPLPQRIAANEFGDHR
ncbi:RNA polymerase subunit sigma-70 [Microlunatus parietis]|uniref:RNA polymerase sigma-70 factor (ECF subfamily) n=1 Tax=Microlunatus parietis TaxID=682979 RepID=A0A7Y9LCF4_9ACTN|nr:RNA polymerase subunit sigma-70 [Microlunatus parietis]NYE71655.1 RNA polymerase sigma-70 factor (ECF subfamily) [Microlunatus parietis]